MYVIVMENLFEKIDTNVRNHLVKGNGQSSSNAPVNSDFYSEMAAFGIDVAAFEGEAKQALREGRQNFVAILSQ